MAIVTSGSITPSIDFLPNDNRQQQPVVQQQQQPVVQQQPTQQYGNESIQNRNFENQLGVLRQENNELKQQLQQVLTALQNNQQQVNQPPISNEIVERFGGNEGIGAIQRIVSETINKELLPRLQHLQQQIDNITKSTGEIRQQTYADIVISAVPNAAALFSSTKFVDWLRGKTDEFGEDYYSKFVAAHEAEKSGPVIKILKAYNEANQQPNGQYNLQNNNNNGQFVTPNTVNPNEVKRVDNFAPATVNNGNPNYAPPTVTPEQYAQAAVAFTQGNLDLKTLQQYEQAVFRNLNN